MEWRSVSESTKYYDWNSTFTYDADVTIVIGPRGCGKTYGLRKQCVKDWKKDGSRFVEVCRYKDELADISSGYFDKLEINEEFPALIFKTDKHYAYVAKKPKGDAKPDWKIVGYFVALTQMQRSKKKTYTKVKRLIMDEALLDRRDRYHRYLPSEFSLLANVVDSCTRENPNNDEQIRPHLYLLGNAVDLTNPYFARYKIRKVPEFGKSWHDRKTCLLDYIDASIYAESKVNDTLAGRMARGTIDEAIIAYNKFAGIDDETIAKKTKDAKYLYTLSSEGKEYSVWCSMSEGLYFVNDKKPKSGGIVYALTNQDNEANYIVIRKADGLMKTLVDGIYYGIVRYETREQKENLLALLRVFGLR